MSHIFELAEELGTSPKELKQWLRQHGFGSGKTISHRATREARAHFKPQTDHPMASALEERDGLGAVKRHEELLDLGDGIKVESRPQLKWGKVKRSEVDLLDMDMSSQKDFFKSLRGGGSESVAGETSQARQVSTPSEQIKSAEAKKNKAVHPSTQVKPKSRPSREQIKSQGQHSVFGSLASMSAQLDSVTDRTRSTATIDDAEAVRAMSAGVKPISSQKSAKASKKTKKSAKKAKKSARATEQPLPSVEQLRSPQEPSFKELFERPEVQSLSAQVDELKTALKSLQVERDELLNHSERLTAEREELLGRLETIDLAVPKIKEDPAPRPRAEPSLIWDHFESFGLDAQQARFALLELLDHPQRGPEIIYSLKHDQPRSLTRGFAIVCEDEVCRQVADTYARQGLIEFTEKHLCSVCQGSTARGWYRRLHLTATYTQRERILVVGGDDHDHQLIKQLDREVSGLQWEFITGSSRIDQGVANAKVAKQSAVILWGGTHLPHALSNVVKGAASRAQVPQCALPPGKRSVAYLCASILKLWGLELEEDLDIL